jgi:hypothetical protein
MPIGARQRRYNPAIAGAPLSLTIPSFRDVS